MKKRIVTVALWFYVAWYAWAMAAWFLGISGDAGPIFGAIVATIMAVELRRLLTSKPDPEHVVAAPSVFAEPARQ